MFTVENVKTLGWKDDKKIKEILAKVCKQIQPILTKRKWSVGILLEFYPQDPALLGLNVDRGREIKVRCRMPHNKNTFYDFNHIIGTVLHELAHIEIGPHNAEFKKLWDTLWDELEDYQSKGIEGFDKIFEGCGQKLSTYQHNPITVYEAKKLGAKAAEKRLAHSQLMGMGNGPQKLGGNNTSNKSAKELAAEAALKRYKTTSTFAENNKTIKKI